MIPDEKSHGLEVHNENRPTKTAYVQRFWVKGRRYSENILAKSVTSAVARAIGKHSTCPVRQRREAKVYMV